MKYLFLNLFVVIFLKVSLLATSMDNLPITNIDIGQILGKECILPDDVVAAKNGNYVFTSIECDGKNLHITKMDVKLNKVWDLKVEDKDMHRSFIFELKNGNFLVGYNYNADSKKISLLIVNQHAKVMNKFTTYSDASNPVYIATADGGFIIDTIKFSANGSKEWSFNGICAKNISDIMEVHDGYLYLHNHRMHESFSICKAANNGKLLFQKKFPNSKEKLVAENFFKWDQGFAVFFSKLNENYNHSTSAIFTYDEFGNENSYHSSYYLASIGFHINSFGIKGGYYSKESIHFGNGLSYDRLSILKVLPTGRVENFAEYGYESKKYLDVKKVQQLDDGYLVYVLLRGGDAVMFKVDINGRVVPLK